MHALSGKIDDAITVFVFHVPVLDTENVRDGQASPGSGMQDGARPGAFRGRALEIFLKQPERTIMTSSRA